MTDEALVAACTACDASALAALFDRFGRDVHRFLVRMRGVDDHVVDDLVQDTFLAAYDGARRFRRGSAVRTWLFAIAGNVAKGHIRGEIRRRGRAAVYLEKAPVQVLRPDLESEQRELLARMPRALLDLPHDQRTAFLLCDVEGARGVDAAKALGIRPGTLYRRLHEARHALRHAVMGGEP
ncbi:MAG: RNA polymerase sigma factor [Deltaproteobacteria bacterium]|nr:RNA polymerase sigma factor [Deltaproteobacteria bacterium]